MKSKVSILFLCLLFLFSCSNVKKKSSAQDQFILTVNIANADGNLSYLHQLTDSKTIVADSAIIKNGKAVFSGNVNYPERHLITITNVFGGKLVIIENDTINIQATKDDLTKAVISNSKINTELTQFQKKSMAIYDKMDLLFPDLQRARLENNVKKLAEITTKMKSIEKENIDFNFKYAQDNPTSYISAMILNDLSRRDSIDINKIKTIYTEFSNEVKKSIDSQKLDLLVNSVH